MRRIWWTRVDIKDIVKKFVCDGVTLDNGVAAYRYTIYFIDDHYATFAGENWRNTSVTKPLQTYFVYVYENETFFLSNNSCNFWWRFINYCRAV